MKLIKTQKGSATIEFLAIFPLILFSVLFFWQLALVAYTVIVSEAAVRDGARVASVVDTTEDDCIGTVLNSTHSITVDVIQCGEKTEPIENERYGTVVVEIEARVPSVKLPFIEKLDLKYTAKAKMPYEGR